MRKPHPCGSYDWRVVRLGADIGLRCQKCNRRVLLARSVFERRLKAIIGRASNTQGREGTPSDQSEATH
ncbi:MAG: DUF951 domain-containing protein [Bacteroidetes bacterium]|nr:DUF951 domain-containing protein [Bacteroidota bacterium]MCL5026910.1 DUF951 domain-containing protein [Chloroflexota bacterium]